MLKAEPNTLYDIYPSWAEYHIDWPTLKPLVSDPLNSGCLDQNDRWWINEKGIRPQVPEAIETLDGPAGGGIVIEHRRTAPPGLAWYVLKGFAEGSAPMGVDSNGTHGVAHVVYMLPSRALYLDIGGPRPKVYDQCYITFEHVESAGDALYWLVDFTGTKGIAGLDEIPTIAKGFGLDASRLPQPPSGVAAEIADWPYQDDHQFVWYRLSGGRDGIGYQFAIVVYVALHLCKVAGRHFKTMHLIAQLETETRFRVNWRFHPANPIMKKR